MASRGDHQVLMAASLLMLATMILMELPVGVLGYCRPDTGAGFTKTCHDIHLSLDGKMLDATCERLDPLSDYEHVHVYVVNLPFPLDRHIENRDGQLVARSCRRHIGSITSWRVDCGFSNSCRNMRLSPDGAILTADCSIGGGTFTRTQIGLDTIIGNFRGVLDWTCTAFNTSYPQ